MADMYIGSKQLGECLQTHKPLVDTTQSVDDVQLLKLKDGRNILYLKIIDATGKVNRLAFRLTKQQAKNLKN